MFLEEFFNDTPSVIQPYDCALDIAAYLVKSKPDILFVSDELLTKALVQKLRAYRQTVPGSRIFKLETTASSKGQLDYDFVFKEPIFFPDFQNKLAEQLPLPESIRVLVVDDEPEIGAMFKAFLQDKSKPSFQVEHRGDGEKGLAYLEGDRPDILLLDVKMPIMDGIEVYRRMAQKKMDMPVIIFFDSIFGDEIIEIHKIGRPAIVEKGSQESQLPQMHSLILKMFYFA